jgi:hypothetical protein
MKILANETALRDYLLANDDRYRELALEHKRYEVRLSELTSLPYPTEKDLIEETILKRKRLLLKDQMEAIAYKYKTGIFNTPSDCVVSKDLSDKETGISDTPFDRDVSKDLSDKESCHQISKESGAATINRAYRTEQSANQPNLTLSESRMAFYLLVCAVVGYADGPQLPFTFALRRADLFRSSGLPTRSTANLDRALIVDAN